MIEEGEMAAMEVTEGGENSLEEDKEGGEEDTSEHFSMLRQKKW